MLAQNDRNIFVDNTNMNEYVAEYYRNTRLSFELAQFDSDKFK